ncbi:MAG: LexA family transcriptional regulator [Thermodesulfobacteriota bacterium]
MAISPDKIEARRVAIGLSVSELSRRAGISRKTYYDWVNGRLPVSSRYAPSMSEVLNMAIEDLSAGAEGKEEAVKCGVPEGSFDIREVKERTQWAVNYIIKTHALSNVKLSSILGLSASTVDGYRRGVKMPKFETLAYLQDRYRISLDWIVDGLDGPFTDQRREGAFAAPLPSAEKGIGHEGGPLPPGEFVFIPQMAGTTSNGELAPDGMTEMRIAFRRDWIARKGLPQNMSIIKVQGDSMEPMLLSGDLVLVDRSKDATTRGGLFAITIDGEVLIKRIQPLMDSRLLVISDNEKYTALEIETGNIHINGKVIWFARELER